MFQLLEQLRENRSTLKAPQLQVLEQMEAQLSAMNLHQQQVHHLLSDIVTERHIHSVCLVGVFWTLQIEVYRNGLLSLTDEAKLFWADTTRRPQWAVGQFLTACSPGSSQPVRTTALQRSATDQRSRSTRPPTPFGLQ